MDPLRLIDLSDGHGAVVDDYDPEIPASRRERLEDLGLIPETPVTRERAAPMGDPLLFRVRGTMICLRKSDAKYIRIRR